MRIPIGNFGYQTADAQTGRRAPPVDAFVQRGNEAIGSALHNIAGDMRAEQEAARKQREAEQKVAERTQAALVWEEHTNNVTQTTQEAVQKIQSGELHRTDALDWYQKQIASAASKAMENISPDLKGPSEIKFNAVAHRGTRALQGAIDANFKSEIASKLEAIRNGMMQQVTLPGADVASLTANFETTANELGRQAGLDPAHLSKLTTEFRDTANFSNFKKQLLDASGSIKSLKTLGEQIKTAESLDSDKRLALLASAQSQIEVLKNRQLVEADRRERANAHEWSAAVDIVQAGKPLSADYAAQLQRQFKGTGYGRALKELIQQAPSNLAFSAQPVASQERALLALQAKGNTQGWNPAEQKQYEALDKVFRATQNDIKADPWKAGIERGVLREVSPLNIMDVQTLPQQLAARRDQSHTLSAWTGRPVSPFRPEEAHSLGATLSALPAPQRADMLGMLAQQMNPAQMRALSGQIGEKYPALATAGLLASRPTTAGRSAAEIYLKGVDAVKEKRLTFDDAKQSRIREEMHAQIEGAYASENATRAALDAAFGVYAGLKSEGGSGDVRKAVTLATGGIMEFNGGKIARPWGWSESRVRDTVKSFTPDHVRKLYGENVLVNGEPMSAATFAKSLPNARLGPSPQDGAYSVIIGRRMVTDLSGRPIILPLVER